MKLAYGYTIEPHGRDPLVDLADRALMQFSAAAVPGAWLVDTIPACLSNQIPTSLGLLTEFTVRYLPEWMPGAGFKKTARQWKATLTETVEIPMRFVKKQMAEKHSESSYVSALYEKAGPRIVKQEEDHVKFSAASLYAGGADTVSSNPVLSKEQVWAPFLTCNHRRP